MKPKLGQRSPKPPGSVWPNANLLAHVNPPRSSPKHTTTIQVAKPIPSDRSSSNSVSTSPEINSFPRITLHPFATTRCYPTQIPNFTISASASAATISNTPSRLWGSTHPWRAMREHISSIHPQPHPHHNTNPVGATGRGCDDYVPIRRIWQQSETGGLGSSSDRHNGAPTSVWLVSRGIWYHPSYQWQFEDLHRLPESPHWAHLVFRAWMTRNTACNLSY